MSQTSLNQSDFEPIEIKSSEAEKIAGESTSYWKDAWRRFRKNKLAMASIVVIIFLAIMAALGTVLSGQNYYDNDLIKDRKSTRLNSSHVSISYAVFCLKKKKIYILHIVYICTLMKQ